MLLADITLSTEALVAIGGLLATLSGVIGYLFREMLKAKDERLSEMKSYKEIAHEATTALEAKVNEGRREAGLPPTKVLADVVPEHNSQVTEQQRETAALQTLRAKITAAKLALGLPARVVEERREDVSLHPHGLTEDDAMSSVNQKALAEKFRAIADDKAAVAKLADETTAANSADAEVVRLCKQFKNASDGSVVRDLADQVKAR